MIILPENTGERKSKLLSDWSSGSSHVTAALTSEESSVERAHRGHGGGEGQTLDVNVPLKDRTKILDADGMTHYALLCQKTEQV